jgi:hypothetical protein
MDHLRSIQWQGLELVQAIVMGQLDGRSRINRCLSVPSSLPSLFLHLQYRYYRMF